MATAGRYPFCDQFRAVEHNERKNPVAVVDAFQKAFRGHSGVRLIVKLNNAAPVQDNCEVLHALKARCDADTRIQLIDKTLSYQNVLSYTRAAMFLCLFTGPKDSDSD